MKDLQISDVGPIESLTIPLPDGGGVVVLRGRNGAGKTHALAAIGTLLGSKSRPPSRDGSLGAVVEGLGARLTVARRATRSGEIEIAHLEGEDPSLLVDPGLKDAGAADAERIRALLRLARAEVDPLAFASLVGGETEFRELCRESTLQATDVPAMAGAVKRDFEAAARKSENEAENLHSRAQGVASTLADLLGDTGKTAILDGVTLAQARLEHEKAIRVLERAESTQVSARKRIEAAAEARVALEEMGDAGTKESIEGTEAETVEIGTEIRRLRSELQAAEARAQQAEQELHRQKQAARQREALERSIEAAADARKIPAEELEDLRERTIATNELVERASILERSAGLREDANRLATQATAAAMRGAELRQAARATETVVTEAVSGVCGDDLSIREGRLMVRVGRGLIPFAELSQGERWRKSLDIAVSAVGASGLLVVRQEAWEGLDPENRKAVAEHAKTLGTVIVTAESDDGEIRAETLR